MSENYSGNGICPHCHEQQELEVCMGCFNLLCDTKTLALARGSKSETELTEANKEIERLTNRHNELTDKFIQLKDEYKADNERLKASNKDLMQLIDDSAGDLIAADKDADYAALAWETGMHMLWCLAIAKAQLKEPS